MDVLELKATVPVRAGSVEPAEARLGVVIVTRNRAETLLGTLAKLTSLTPGYPIVIVDNASTDGTVAKVQRRFPHIQTMSLPRNGGAVARNYGVRRLPCEYIAFSDDDSWWHPGALEQAVNILDEHPGIGLLAARVLAGAERRLDPTSALMRESPLRAVPDVPGQPVLGFLACASIVRRDAFLDAGGFHAWFRSGGEETYLATELAQGGWNCIYRDDLIAYHEPSNQREPAVRSVEGHANRLWEAWLQRRPAAAARVTLEYLGRSAVDPSSRKGFGRAVARLPEVLRHRRPVSPTVEAQLRLLEDQQRDLSSRH